MIDPLAPWWEGTEVYRDGLWRVVQFRGRHFIVAHGSTRCCDYDTLAAAVNKVDHERRRER